MWEKEKISKSLSVGLVALVFIFLSLQFVFFVAKVIEIRKYNRELAAVQSEVGGKLSVAGRDTSVTGGNGPASGNRQNRARESDGVLSDGALQGRQHESSLQTDTSAVQRRDLSGVVARTFSLEKLPPRPVGKPRPKVELNSADTTALMTLYGIGGYYARKIVDFRKRLGGSFASPEQLMDIYNFDREKFEALADLVTVSPENVTPYPLWSLPADSLRRHPYVDNLETARAIVLYRENTPSDRWTVEGLEDAGILSPDKFFAVSAVNLI